MDDGEIRIFNSAKILNLKTIVFNYVLYRNAMIQARTGIIVTTKIHEATEEQEEVQIRPNTNEERVYNQISAINMAISSLIEIIGFSSATAKDNDMVKWKKRYINEEERKENPFEDYRGYYKYYVLMNNCLKFLKESQKKLFNMNMNKENIFLSIEEAPDNKKEYYINDKFFEFLDQISRCFEKIDSILILNKINSAGKSTDEEWELKRIEKEFLARVKGG
ncbi:MAG: hypothetical protein IMZ60_02485 [Actinobacteria bacterium]|nr:hypothetical protein [Actinomycetota bacterium]